MSAPRVARLAGHGPRQRCDFGLCARRAVAQLGAEKFCLPHIEPAATWGALAPNLPAIEDAYAQADKALSTAGRPA